MEHNLQAVVLAAGKSSRFKTNHSKLLEKICGQEMILYTTKLLSSFNVSTTLVVGYKKELVQDLINKHHKENVNFVHQTEQLGTGHALKCTKEFWEKDNVLVLNGDVPLITPQIIESLYQKHTLQNAEITFVVAHNIDPTLNSYGRVIQEGGRIKIVEAKDDTRENPEHCCINAGIYLFKREFLEKNIDEISKSKVTGELYITDLITLASKKGFKVETVSCQMDAIRGINTIEELLAAEQIKRSEIITKLMRNGVRFASAHNAHVDLNASIGSGSYIGAGTQICGDTVIGQNCKVEAFCYLDNSVIEDNVSINSHTVVKNSIIKSNALVGPFASIHSNSVISSNAVVVNFAEVKNSTVSETNKSLATACSMEANKVEHETYVVAKKMEHDKSSESV